eukprot:502392-Prorocentrum_minimum.AAC.4
MAPQSNHLYDEAFKLVIENGSPVRDALRGALKSTVLTQRSLCCCAYQRFYQVITDCLKASLYRWLDCGAIGPGYTNRLRCIATYAPVVMRCERVPMSSPVPPKNGCDWAGADIPRA